MARPPQKRFVSPAVLVRTAMREIRNSAAGLTGKERKAVLKWAAEWWAKALFEEPVTERKNENRR